MRLIQVETVFISTCVLISTIYAEITTTPTTNGASTSDPLSQSISYSEPSSTQASSAQASTTASSITTSTTTKPANVKENKDYWMKLGRESVQEAIKNKLNEGIAKNVIIFVGDGMGVATVTASRIYKGQLAGNPGEEGYLTFEKFKNAGLIKTYNVDRQVPDSAGTATALFSGVKANMKTVGFDATIATNTCVIAVQDKAKVSSIINWAIAAKKSTGLVTTTRITHATPAAAYAHSSHRDWECDTAIPVPERGKGCKDIARQLVEDEPGRSINVILGGGEQQFRSALNKTTSCVRSDNKDLIWDWMQFHKNNKKQFKFVSTKKALNDVDDSKIDHLLGLFNYDHLPYDMDRDMGPEGHPSLEEMTRKAVKILQKNTKGFVLIVEGGRIDHAHHDNLAKIALEETIAMDKAIAAAYSMTKPKDTLIVVTADHSHSFTINGYPKRGNPIEGISDVTPEGYAYQTLSYMNGPGYSNHRMNETVENSNGSTSNTLSTWRNLNLTANANMERQTRHFAGFWMKDETHGGEDVPVYASGPMGHLFNGVHEQTHVAFTMAYSACIGPYASNCRSDAASNLIKSNISIFVIFYLIVLRIF